jgi:hypothetical protein
MADRADSDAAVMMPFGDSRQAVCGLNRTAEDVMENR